MQSESSASQLKLYKIVKMHDISKPFHKQLNSKVTKRQMTIISSSAGDMGSMGTLLPGQDYPDFTFVIFFT